MGGGGSALAMIQSIRENMALLGKRRAYFKAKAELTKASEKLKITYQKATPEQLRLVRKRLKKQRLINRIKSTIIIFIFSPIIIYGCYLLWPAIDAEIPDTEGQIFNKYYANLNKGDDYFKKGYKDYAEEMYSRADKLMPNTAAIDIRMALIYSFSCLHDTTGCNTASWRINDLYIQDKKNKLIHQLNAIHIRAYNITHPNDTVAIKFPNLVGETIHNKFMANRKKQPKVLVEQ